MPASPLHPTCDEDICKPRERKRDSSLSVGFVSPSLSLLTRIQLAEEFWERARQTFSQGWRDGSTTKGEIEKGPHKMNSEEGKDLFYLWEERLR